MKFSILTALLLTAIVALTITLVIRQTEFAQLDTLVEELKQDAGYFEIENSELACIRQLNCEIPNAWRFAYTCLNLRMSPFTLAPISVERKTRVMAVLHGQSLPQASTY